MQKISLEFNNKREEHPEKMQVILVIVIMLLHEGNFTLISFISSFARSAFKE